MGLESATYVSQLVATNPISTDVKSQGDDHLRLLKSALQNTLPNADKAYYFPSTATKTGNYSVLANDQNKLILINTSSASPVMTLPTLTVNDAGWECSFIKTNTGSNPYFIAPPTGTIQSGEYDGLTRTRRCIPGRRTRVVWTGSSWIAERVCSEPVGATIEIQTATLPVGYEWPNGQTLASASTNYPEFYIANGNSGVTFDERGRVTAGKDDMGGTSANRLTTPINGDTLGAAGGAESVALTEAQLAAHTHGPGTYVAAAHTHPYQRAAQKTEVSTGTNKNVFDGNLLDDTSSTGPLAVSGSSASAGTGQAHSNVQPTIVKNKVLVVE